MPVQNPRQSLGNRFQNALFGTMQEAPPQPINIDGQNVQTGVNYQPRTGGILNDFAAGYKQNRDNGFSPENLMPKDTNFAARSGEALGTLARQFNKLKQPDNLAMLALGLGTAADISNIRGGVYDPSKNAITNLYNMNYKHKELEGLNEYRKAQLNYRNRELEEYKLQQLKQRDINNMQNSYSKQLKMLDDRFNRGFYRNNPQEYSRQIEALQNQYSEDIKKLENYAPGTISESNQTRTAEIMPLIAGQNSVYNGIRTQDTHAKSIEEKIKNNIRASVRVAGNNGGFINMYTPTGKIIKVPSEKIEAAIRQGAEPIW